MPAVPTLSRATAADTATDSVIIRVALPVPLAQTFDYLHDTPLANGVRVRVPFGNRKLVGVVTDTVSSSDHGGRLRAIDEVLDPEPLLDASLLALLHWTATYYHHPIGEVLTLGFPARLRRGDDTRQTLIDGWCAVAGFDSAELTRAPAQQAALALLPEAQPVPAARLRAAGVSAATLRALASRGAIERTWIEPATLPALQPDSRPRPQLTDEQRAAVDAVEASSGFSVTLLDGVTGSGKTEVYLELLASVMQQGRQALVLVPEIGLTPQTVARFRDRFNHVDVAHSSLADGQRSLAWQHARSGRTRILIGTRSAVFTPLPELGMVIIDEEHDSSFKQHDGMRYSARDVAIKRARDLGIPVVLGSATPSFESLNNALSGRYRHARLTRRPGQAQPPHIQLVDLRGADTTDGIATDLERTMRRHLEADGQVLVFLNRRGYAPVLRCTACGWMAECPHCDVRLTLHRRPAGLRCHHCDFQAAVPLHCPHCEAPGLTSLGSGTQRIEDRLNAALSDWPLHRIDRDSTRSLASLGEVLDEVASGKPLTLVGTQMLAKGHHFPNVTLVAVLNADAGLFSADFRGAERTAQTIIQVSGRAGRANRPGEVHLQTHHPDHPLMQHFRSGDYAAFAREALAERRTAGLPPYAFLALIRAEAASAEAAAGVLRSLRAELPRRAGLDVLGPIAAPIERVSGQQRFQLLLRASERRPLHAALGIARRLLADAPRNVRTSLDIDPLDML